MSKLIQTLMITLAILLLNVSYGSAQASDPWTVEGRKAWIDEVNGVEPDSSYEWVGDDYVVETHEPADEQTIVDTEELGPNSYDADNPDQTVPFWDDLNGRGAWVWTDELGWSWIPSDRGQGWQPYQNGQWVLTDAGWAFESNESYGSIVYHYGRWVYLSGYGWVWVPGRRWAPAWVSWRVSDGHVGWCPMAPRFYGPYYAYMGNPMYWSFVETRYFLSPGIYRVVIPRYRAKNVYSRTRRIARSHRYGRARFNPGPNPKRIRNYVGRAPQRRPAQSMRRGAVPRASSGRTPARVPERRAVPNSPRRNQRAAPQPGQRYNLRGRTINPRARQTAPSRSNERRQDPGARFGGKSGAQSPSAAPPKRGPGSRKAPRSINPERRTRPSGPATRGGQQRKPSPSAQPRRRSNPQRAVRPPASKRQVAPRAPQSRRVTPRGGVDRSKAKARQKSRKSESKSRNNNSRGRRPRPSRGR